MEEIALLREDGSHFYSVRVGASQPAPGGIAIRGEVPPLAMLTQPGDKFFAQHLGKRWRAYLSRSRGDNVTTRGDLTVLLTLLSPD